LAPPGNLTCGPRTSTCTNCRMRRSSVNTSDVSANIWKMGILAKPGARRSPGSRFSIRRRERSYTSFLRFRKWPGMAIMVRHTPRDGADGLKEADMNQPQAVKDASHLYEVERRALHAVRPGFRISELQLS